MQEIIHNVPLVDASQQNGTFIAGLAMVLSWKSSSLINADELINQLRGIVPQVDSFNDSYLTRDHLDAIFSAENLVNKQALPPETDALAALIVNGPVLVVFLDPSSNHVVHALVIIGIMGDGSQEGSTLYLNDPGTGNEAKKYSMSLLQYSTAMKQAIARESGNDLQNAVPSFGYFDSSAEGTVSSIHHSFSSETESKTY